MNLLIQLMVAGVSLLPPHPEDLCYINGQDAFLFELYKQAPKEDRWGKFARSDVKAARRAGMLLEHYVIWGMHPAFRGKLYAMLFTMKTSGLNPGITSAFRDDYRQSLIVGRNKSAVGYSWHGGSKRGGWGHGRAADVVNTAGTTRTQRLNGNSRVWAWIDARKTLFGIGRAYGNRDAPHVVPIGGREWAATRGLRTRIARAAARAERYAKRKHVRLARTLKRMRHKKGSRRRLARK